ncbi:hypothetical protein ACFL4G_09585 [Thermodesulfobacteriota bacterium]
MEYVLGGPDPALIEKRIYKKSDLLWPSCTTSTGSTTANSIQGASCSNITASLPINHHVERPSGVEMSLLQEQIQKCMLSKESRDEGQFLAVFCFPDDFIGFQGHFPDRPVLPGVCKVHTILVILQTHYGRPVRLEEVVGAKFLAPVQCNEMIRFDCRIQEIGDELYRVRTSVSCENKNTAKIDLKVRFGGKPPPNIGVKV